jgi:hypothetical protein
MRSQPDRFGRAVYGDFADNESPYIGLNSRSFLG